MSRASPDRAGGFTLFEVLAAVALLGILFTTLAGVASAWLRAEGEARRRFEASLAADVRLGELEAEVAAGKVPEPDQSEAVDEPFRITTRVEPLTPPVELFEEVESAKSSRQGPAQGAAAPTLFPAPGSSFQAPLRLITVLVRWDEGDEERRVERTTLALDLEAAAPALVSVARERESQGPEAGAGARSGARPQGATPPAGRGVRRRLPRPGADGAEDAGGRPGAGSEGSGRPDRSRFRSPGPEPRR
jgi:general secretion pathway protein I